MARAPFVAMLTDLCKEERVSVVADTAGYTRDEALGRLFRMWAWCTDRGLEDAPDDCEGYAVPDAVIRRFLGPRGVEAILGGDVDEFALGERRPDGLIYLRGTSETVTRLRKFRSTAVAGGEARKDAGRGDDGRFVGKPTISPADGPPDDQPASSRHPASVQLESSLNPASSSVIPQATDQREDLSGLPDPPASRKPDRLAERAAEISELAVGEINRLARRNFDPETKDTVDCCRRLAREKRTDTDVILVIQSKRDWIGDPKMGKHFEPGTLLGPKFAKYLDAVRSKQPALTLLPKPPDYDEPDLSYANKP